MQKKTLLIVMLFCYGFATIGQAQNLDFWPSIQAAENAKNRVVDNKPKPAYHIEWNFPNTDSIIGYLPTDSIIGYISIRLDYRDIPRPNGDEEHENESEQESEENSRLLVEKRQALLWSLNIDVPLGETSLSDEQKAKLDEIANILKKYSDVHVNIFQHNLYKYRGTPYGYGKGWDDRDKKIFKCACVAKEYLMLKGVSKERIEIPSIPL